MPVTLILHRGALAASGSTAAPPARHGPPAPFNDGRGDARAGIRPNVPPITDPPVPVDGPGSWIRLQDWLAGGVDPAQRAGIVLMPAEDPLSLAGRLDAIAALAIAFPRATDGRGYSLARLVRQRLGWTGPLVAVGRVHRDQLWLMARVGFDRFLLPEGEDAAVAATALGDFALAYAASGDAAPARIAPADAVLPARIAAAGRLLRAAAGRHGTLSLVTGHSPADRVLADLVAQAGVPVRPVPQEAGSAGPPGDTGTALVTARHGAGMAGDGPSAARDDDPGSGLVRYHPLAGWSAADLAAYLAARSAPALPAGQPATDTAA